MRVERISGKFKRLIVWTLIFVILFANIAALLMTPKVVKAAEVVPGIFPGICQWDYKAAEPFTMSGTDIIQSETADTISHSYHYNGSSESITYTSPTIIKDRTEINKFKNYNGSDIVYGETTDWLLLFSYPKNNNYYLVSDHRGALTMFYKSGSNYLISSANTSIPDKNKDYNYSIWLNSIYGNCVTNLEWQISNDASRRASWILAFKKGYFPVDSDNWKDYDCSKPPEIVISGNSNLVDEDGSIKERPTITFKLEHIRAKTGAGVIEDNFFYFMSQDTYYSDVAIRINDKGEGWFIIYAKEYEGTQFDGLDSRIGDSVLNVDKDVWNKFINRAYNAPAVAGQPNIQDSSGAVCGKATNQGEGPNNYAVGVIPNRQCINLSDTGWLKGCWKVTDTRTSLIPEQAKTDMCGYSLTSTINPLNWVGLALCAILQLLGSIASFLTDIFFTSVFNAYHQINLHHYAQLTPALVSVAHAEESTDVSGSLSPLVDAFTNSPANQWDWVITAWKFVLGIANLFLVVVLLFLGIVNILHIQYDTYQVKKALPLLIIAVILANFSLLIMRMLLDASNILTTTFMGDTSPGNMVKDLISSVKIDDTLSKHADGTSKGFWGWAFERGLADPIKNIGIMLLAVVCGVVIMAGFLILGVMFYIRYTAIVILGIAAPLAFVAMAFPPTQSLFKQWWGWTSKFVFMKPVAFFLLWIALFVKESDATLSLVGWMVIMVLVYMAILIPWKLGGAVMGMWGGAMGTLFGTKKGGWARKPVEDWAGRRKTDLGTGIMNRIPWLKRKMAGAELDKKMVEERRKTAMAEGTTDLHQRNKGLNFAKLARMKGKQQDLESLEKEFTDMAEHGTLDITDEESKKHFGKTKGGLREELTSSNFRLQKANETLTKRRTLDLVGRAMERLTAHRNLAITLAEKPVELDESGKPVLWSDLMKQSDNLLLEELETKDEGRKAELRAQAYEKQRKAKAFQALHPEIPFEDYANPNINGRYMKMVIPEVVADGQVVRDSESPESIEDFFLHGGTVSEHSASAEDVKNILTGKISQTTPSARWAFAAYSLGAAMKFNDRAVAGKMVATLGRVMENYSPGSFKDLLGKLHDNDPVAAEKMIKEFNKNHRSAGEGKYSRLDEMTPDDVSKLNMTGQGRESELARKIQAQIMSDPTWGYGISPGAFLGQAVGDTGIITAASLQSSRSAEDILSKTILRPANLLGQIRASNAEGLIQDMAVNITTEVNAGVKIDDENIRQQVIGALANFDPSLGIDDLKIKLTPILGENPPIPSTERLTELVSGAKRVKRGLSNITEIENAAMEEVVPYMSDHLKGMTLESANQLHSEFEEKAERFAIKIQEAESKGRDPNIDDRERQDLINLIGRSGSRSGMQLDELKGNILALSDVLRKTGIAIKAATQLKQAGINLNDPNQANMIEIAMREGIRQAFPHPQQTPPTPTPPPQPTGGNTSTGGGQPQIESEPQPQPRQEEEPPDTPNEVMPEE